MNLTIGLLCGREYAFPPAFIDRVNTLGRPHHITAELVKLTGTRMGEPFMSAGTGMPKNRPRGNAQLNGSCIAQSDRGLWFKDERGMMNE